MFYISDVGKKWRLIIFAVVVVLLIAGMAWRRPRPDKQEPIYQGQPQSAWIHSLHEGILGIDYEHNWYSLPREDAVAILIRALESRDPLSQKAYRTVWLKLPSPLRRSPLPNPARSTEDAHRKAAAVLYNFGELSNAGKESQLAIPALIRVLQQDDTDSTRGTAVSALSSIGPRDKRVVAALHEALKDRSPEVREAATNALAKVTPRERTAK